MTNSWESPLGGLTRFHAPPVTTVSCDSDIRDRVDRIRGITYIVRTFRSRAIR
jgi:hypothetical protein